MKKKHVFNQIIDFTKFLEEQSNSLNYKINISDLKYTLEKDPKAVQSRIDRIIARVKSKGNYELTKEQALLYYLAGVEISWSRPAQNPGEEILHGGFAFNGLTDALIMKTDFWADSVDEFGQNLAKDELDFLERLSWFESPTPHASSRYTPMYGCLEIENGKCPERLYYYDSGAVYKLDMSIESYITNMVDSVAVYCWQYFYIDAEDIIKKNKGIDGSLWSLSMNIDFPEENNRLENIIKYMEYCMEYLPSSFPGKDFSFHNKKLLILKSML